MSKLLEYMLLHRMQPEVSVTKAIAAAGNYIADDVLSENVSSGTVWTFTDVVPVNNDKGYIVKAHALWETLGLTPSLTLFLFTAAPTSELNDNLPNTAPLHADIANYIGRIDFPAMSGAGGDSESVAVPSTSGNTPLAFQCASASRDLIGIVVTNDAITGEVATNDLIIRLTVELA